MSAALLLCLCLVAPGAFGQVSEPQDPGSSLVAVLLHGWRMPPGGFASVPRDAVRTYLDRETRFRSALKPPSDKDWAVQVGFDVRRRMERVAFSLFDVPESARLASDYASAATFLYEWEGMSEAPLAEAKGTEEYLKRNPTTPLAPYLHLLLGHRYSCAAALLESEKKPSEGTRARSVSELKRAEASAHPLILAAARQLLAHPGCGS